MAFWSGVCFVLVRRGMGDLVGPGSEVAPVAMVGAVDTGAARLATEAMAAEAVRVVMAAAGGTARTASR